MSQYDIIFMMLVALIAVNQFIIRSKAWHDRQYLFWVPQIINVSVGCYAILFGLPGIPLPIDVINWIVGGLFLYHFAQNQTKLSRYYRDIREEERERAREEIYAQIEKNDE